MNDFEDRVRRGLTTVARTVPISQPDGRPHRRRPQRMALLSVAAVLVAVAVPLGVVAVMHNREAPVLPASHTTSAPLSPSVTVSGSPSSSPTQVAITDFIVPPRILTLTHQLAAQMWGVQGLYPGPQGPHTLWMCQLGIYGHDGPHTLYVYALCATYSTGPRARMKSSIGLDMVLTVRGTGAQTRLVRFETPSQVNMQQDYKRLFPARILKKIGDVEYQRVLLPAQEQLLALARAARSTTEPPSGSPPASP